MRLLSTLNLLVGALSRMDERWCGILVHHVGSVLCCLHSILIFAVDPIHEPQLRAFFHPLSSLSMRLTQDLQLSDVFTKISVISSCLSGARPLPPAFLSLKDRIIYHERRSKAVRQKHAQIQEEGRDDDSVSSDSDVEDSTDLVPEKVDDTKIGIKELTIRLLMVSLYGLCH